MPVVSYSSQSEPFSVFPSHPFLSSVVLVYPLFLSIIRHFVIFRYPPRSFWSSALFFSFGWTHLQRNSSDNPKYLYLYLDSIILGLLGRNIFNIQAVPACLKWSSSTLIRFIVITFGHRIKLSMNTAYCWHWAHLAIRLLIHDIIYFLPSIRSFSSCSSETF